MFGRGVSPYGTYGLGTAVKSGINWSSLLSNAQKMLGIINQAIPAFYQIKPIFSNMRTMFRVVNEINKDDSKSKKTTSTNTSNNTNNSVHSTSSYDSVNQSIYNSDDDGPSFFV